MTAKQFDTMIKAMRTRYNKVETRTDVTDAIYHLYKGLYAIGRYEIGDKLLELYVEIEKIDTSDVVAMGTFR